MNRFLFSVALCISILPLGAQHSPSLEETALIRFKPLDEKGIAVADWKDVTPEGPRLLGITVHTLSFEDAGLAITYSLEKPERDFFYDIRLSIKDEDGMVIFPEIWSLKGSHKNISREHEHLKAIWANALEESLDFNRQYTLQFTARLYGGLVLLGVSCEKRPAFTYREQLPNYLGLITGSGLIVVGQVYKANADKDYDKYLGLWQNGSSNDEASPFLDAARNKDDTYKILSITGVAVLGLDATNFAFRYFKHKQKLRQYRKYCPREETPEKRPPAFQLSITPGGAGLRAVARF